jgi:hypothetical protein
VNESRSLRTDWFSLTAPLDRRIYLMSGLGLAAIKYLGDASLIVMATGRIWKPTDYLVVTHSLLTMPMKEAPSWLLPALGLWTLPFLWIGEIFTLRRALDAEWSPWWALGFFVPYFNYAVMALFCILPSSEPVPRRKDAGKPERQLLASALLAIAAGVIFGLLMTSLAVVIKGQYSATLFFGTPFAMGALAAFILNREHPASMAETIQMTTFMFVFVGGALFLLAFEGFICLAIAFPIGLLAGLLGAVMGRAIANCGRRSMPPAAAALLVLPLSLFLEPAHSAGKILHEVQSSVEINAPPHLVWPHVVAFQPIPEPEDWLFRASIAYPRSAHINGAGVGAVRYCVFSTGPFVEPITRWEPGARLAFDVTSSPDPLRELSIYSNLSPPHLHGYLRSQRGEFRLVALSGGRTRLEGSTWYEIEMAPEGYWQLWSDFLIHRIHNRVLDHIKLEVESSR